MGGWSDGFVDRRCPYVGDGCRFNECLLLPLLREFVLCWEGVALLYSLLDGSCWVCLPFVFVGAIVDWSRVGEGKKSMKVHVRLIHGGRDVL